MRTRRLLTTWLLIALCLGLVSTGVQAQEPVKLVYFHSPDCERCQRIEADVLPQVVAAYNERIEIVYVDVTRPSGLAQLEGVESRFGGEPNPLPVFLLGDELIANDDLTVLEAALWDACEGQIGAPEHIDAATPFAPTKTPDRIPWDSLRGPDLPVYVAFIYKEGCPTCDRAALILEALRVDYPGMVVDGFNSAQSLSLIDSMGEYLGLPQSQRLVAPSIYIGKDALIGGQVTMDSVRALLSKYGTTGAHPFWEQLSRTRRSERGIFQRFGVAGPTAIALAGLVDGIKPTTLAAMLLFVTHVAAGSRSRRELVATGVAYTMGIFCAYLALGVGILAALRWVSATAVGAAIIYTLLGATCIVLAGASIYDYGLARQGRSDEMRSGLPNALYERVVDRMRRASAAFTGAAFVTGGLVAVLGLVFAGYIYFPAISFVVGVPELRAHALRYLLLYNALSITPLLVALVVVNSGLAAERLESWLVRHAALGRLLMAVLLLLLGATLLAQGLGL